MIKIIHGELWSTNFSQLFQLMSDYSSCKRFCFSRFQRESLQFNDTRNMAKFTYQTLNTRQISDACIEAEGMYSRFGDQKIMFGGRKQWKRLKAGIISNEEWKSIRDGQVYSRGDVSKDGNPNIRLINDATELRITVGNRCFISHKLFIPDKYQSRLHELLASGSSYNVRLMRKDNQHVRVVIDYEINDPIKKIGSFDNGVIGIDTNPDKIAIAVTSPDGNLIKTKTLKNQKLLYASVDKRNNEIGLLVKQVIAIAKQEQKGIAFENLSFSQEYNKGEKKFNRIKSNFVYRKFLELLERKCIENSIHYCLVHPAYTSIIGKLKYKSIYKITTHCAAAYTIGRRALGYKETLSFNGFNRKLLREFVLRNHVGIVQGKRVHSWSLWNILDDKAAVLTGHLSRCTDWYNMSNLEELDDIEDSVAMSSNSSILKKEGENPFGKIYSQELVVNSNERKFIQVDERLPYDVADEN